MEILKMGGATNPLPHTPSWRCVSLHKDFAFNITISQHVAKLLQ
jgi:hypothetical protein